MNIKYISLLSLIFITNFAQASLQSPQQVHLESKAIEKQIKKLIENAYYLQQDLDNDIHGLKNAGNPNITYLGSKIFKELLKKYNNTPEGIAYTEAEKNSIEYIKESKSITYAQSYERRREQKMQQREGKPIMGYLEPDPFIPLQQKYDEARKKEKEQHKVFCEKYKTEFEEAIEQKRNMIINLKNEIVSLREKSNLSDINDYLANYLQ